MHGNYMAERSVSMETQIEKIIDLSKNMDAGDSLSVFSFGKNRDLALSIIKDSQYKDGDEFNLVTIQTAQNGKWVDDTEDTHVSDALYSELERIWNYEGFKTL